jgi:thiol:disulfide interchange protein
MQILHEMTAGKTLVNLLAITLFMTAIGAFLVNQNDKQASAPAPESKITKYRVDFALAKAKAQRRFLIIEFGADWCEDCRVLAHHLEDGLTREYFQNHFSILQIDIGNSDRNFEAARELGVDLDHGIPAVVVFAPDGSRIGSTDNGELEPTRKYRADQILDFLKALVERRAITNPAALQ